MNSRAPIRESQPHRSHKKSKRVRRATILGTGICVPERVIDNSYFSRELGLNTSSEWIESRIGIVQRYWARDESSTDLAVGAAQ
jgi:3-oxoacyl-[acyl-carrier-protein] synthase III